MPSVVVFIQFCIYILYFIYISTQSDYDEIYSEPYEGLLNGKDWVKKMFIILNWLKNKLSMLSPCSHTHTKP